MIKEMNVGYNSKLGSDPKVCTCSCACTGTDGIASAVTSPEHINNEM